MRAPRRVVLAYAFATVFVQAEIQRMYGFGKQLLSVPLMDQHIFPEKLIGLFFGFRRVVCDGRTNCRDLGRQASEGRFLVPGWQCFEWHS